MGKVFSLSHFIIFLYRICILAFDHQPHEPHIRDFNLVKKLLHSLSSLEKSDGLSKFCHRVGRTYTKALTFLPSKHLLAQILICEKLDLYISGRTIDSFSQEDLVSRIIDAEHYIELEHQTSKLKTISQVQIITEENEIGSVLEPHEESLKQIFQIYASFGEPTNTKYLKSSKLQKLMREAGLTVGSTSAARTKYVKQVTAADIDLIYTFCTTKSL